MSAMAAKVPVELSGGPFDGHVDEVIWNPAGRYLFSRRDADGRFEAWTYRWADRSAGDGQRWVLQVDCYVGGSAEIGKC